MARPTARGTGRARLGVISDTHGLLRDEAVRALEGSDFIVHAGDIGSPEILVRLRGIAPLTAVRGNNDAAAWAADIPDTAVLEVEGVSIYVLHDASALPLDPALVGHAVVVAGHSHRPSITRRGEVLFVNPGSAGPRRFRLPISLACMTIERGRVEAAIVDLEHLSSA